MSAVRKIIEDHDCEPSLKRIAEDAFELIHDTANIGNAQWMGYRRRASSSGDIAFSTQLQTLMNGMANKTGTFITAEGVDPKTVVAATDDALVLFAKLLSISDVKDNIEIQAGIDTRGLDAPEGHKPLPDRVLKAHSSFDDVYTKYNGANNYVKSVMKPELKESAKTFLREAARADAAGDAEFGDFVAMMGKMIEFCDTLEQQQGQARSA
ncbi:MAG: hypothetical protein ACN2B6_05040 [Rickettsiales bacterium]